MTGSRAQLYNGILLLVTFFLCRLVWGTYQSVRVYQDVWAALQAPGPLAPSNPGNPASVTEPAPDPTSEIMRYAGKQEVPFWLAITYLGSNIVLNTLNFYWFGKMIETVRRRFQGPKDKGANVLAHGGLEKSANGSATGRNLAEIDDAEVRWRH